MGSAGRLAVLVAAIALLAGCSLVRPLPDPMPRGDRLAVFPKDGLPISQPVTIYWDEHQIPFVEAATDEDLAFALGLVHAHLRLAQMDLMRRIAEGRIAEMAGPIATEIDHSLRILNYPRAAETMEERLPFETRTWLTAFVRGINHYQDSLDNLPHEYSVLGIQREPWTVRDVLTIGRLAGTDVNWLAWFRFLQLRDRDDWNALYRRFLEYGSDSVPSFASVEGSRILQNLLGGSSRSGSNAVAVSASRSSTGGALIASDPHLGIQFPNLWLIVGIKSPGYHAVGLMVPGLPFVALGRNRHIAWGGTNMRAASSDLYDVSHLEAGQFTRRVERIRVRWWFDRTVVVRETEHGPVLSDVPVLYAGDSSFALRWTGHERGDEVSAMLRASRATNWQEFRAAFEPFAVSAQNMIYADVNGNIGQLMAAHLPIRANGRPDDIVLDPRKPENLWRGFATARDLPSTYNPASGYVASANNRPAETDLPVGYIFSPNDRIERLHQILSGRGPFGVDEMRELQLDVYMPSAAALNDAYLARIDAIAPDELTEAARRAMHLMREWNGEYHAAQPGPVAFEAFHAAFVREFYARRFAYPDEAAAYTGAGRIKEIVIADLADTPADRLGPLLADAAREAGEAIGEFPDWGSMHRLGLAHPLSFAPVIGARYRFSDLPTSGSTDTIMKTAHRATGERHFTFYGQNARHISDLSDPDRNYFILLGGQDGWIASANALDQLDLWQRGEYVQVPMRLETVRRDFDVTMRLTPATH